jgi:hypothetical protein
MGKYILLLLGLIVTVSVIACSSGESTDNPREATVDTGAMRGVKLKITIGEGQAVAVLDDSETARDFVSLLPLTLTMTDYNGTEKVSDLPRKLNLEGASAGFDPSAGDITTFAPWGNLAVFYEDFGYSNGLVPLARIESGLEFFAEQSGDFEMTINVAE